jgi:outer membrane protein OmpA-like peptidoglycan-associated protein/tetratricopeptide (TPR) repeat protein
MRFVMQFCFLFVFVGINTCVLAQYDVQAYHKYFEEGNELFLEKNYTEAVKSYRRAFQLDSTNDNMRFKLGVAYLFSPNEKHKAMRYLEKAAKHTTEHYKENDVSERQAPAMAIYYLAMAYHLNYQFDKAKTKFQSCAQILNDKKIPKDIKVQIDQCNVGAQLMKNMVDVKIENLGPALNTVYPEYCPIINADESTLIFTSRRPGGMTEEIAADGQYYEDVYVSNKTEDGSWGKPTLIEGEINTKDNDAAIGLSPDGNRLFIYSSDNGGDVLYSKLEGSHWGKPRPLGSDINTKYWETHACVTADGQTIYFVSDRPGGYGGRDIYKCVMLPNGNWSLATNLGPTINTPYDEDAPFIHTDGVTLFYSSNGPGSMGGFDIFYSKKTEAQGINENAEKWSKPANLGYPINTTGDDVFYVLSADGKRAYFSSAREGSLGDKDLFKMTMKNVVVDPTALLVGYLTFNGHTTDIPKDVRISAIDKETGELVQEIRPNYKTGKYLMVLNPGPNGKTYKLNFEASGYLPVTEELKVDPGSSYEELKKETRLKLVNFETKKSGDVSLTGLVSDDKGNPIPDVKLVVKDNTSGKILKIHQIIGDSGLYYVSLPTGKNYNVSYEEDGYLFHSENIDIPKQTDFSVIRRNVTLQKVEMGSSVVLKNVFFGAGNATLTESSKAELEKLYDILTQNVKLKAEISGHTDITGSEDVNLRLSQERAQAVVDYLVKNKRTYYVAPYYYKGIDKKRLVPVGYGSSKPIADNDTPEGMQLNRRVEMKITSTK